VGSALVVLGAAVALLAGERHRRDLRRLDRGEGYTAPRWSLGVAVAFLLAALGAVMVVYLVLVGE
jgi:hypothetical protein